MRFPITPYIATVSAITAQAPCKNWLLSALRGGPDPTLQESNFGTCKLNGTSGWWLRRVLIHYHDLHSYALAILNVTDNWPMTEWIFELHRPIQTPTWRDLLKEAAKATYSDGSWQTRSRARISVFNSYVTSAYIINLLADGEITTPPVTVTDIVQG